jgi:hypothetical protein
MQTKHAPAKLIIDTALRKFLVYTISENLSLDDEQLIQEFACAMVWALAQGKKGAHPDVIFAMLAAAGGPSSVEELRAMAQAELDRHHKPTAELMN